jgi:hypothetical protein
MIFLHYESIVSEMDAPAPARTLIAPNSGRPEPGFTPENALLLSVEGFYR